MICENCGKEHDGSYGSGRFCSKECAKSFSSKTLKGQLKKAKCINCGKIIYIDKRASEKTCKCNDCITNPKKIKQLRENKYKRYIKCPICGQQHLIFENCNNKFCNEHNIRQFKSLINYFGFDKNKLGTLEVEKEFNRVRDLLYNLYWKEHLSSKEIANKFKYPNIGNITGKIFHYLNIPSKRCKEAILENIEYGKFLPENNYKSFSYQIWHTT